MALNLNLLKFLSWTFSNKYDRRRISDLYKEIRDRDIVKKIDEARKNYLPKLRADYSAKKRKISVFFINFEPSKWSYQSTYEAFAKDPDFDPFVYITLRDSDVKNHYKSSREMCEKSYLHFKNKKMNAVWGYDFVNRRPISIDEYHPDIIFYQDPWAHDEHFSFYKTGLKSLTMIASYGSAISRGINEFPVVYPLFFKVFYDNWIARENIISHWLLDENKIVVAGQPKLDAYLKPVDESKIVWKKPKEGNGIKRIIYAPHHTCYDSASLRYGTFDTNHDFFLQFAKENPDIEFIFKPHPELFNRVIEKDIMSKKEAENYWKTWRELPNTQIYDKGDYFDMFRTSDLLITDCNSFLLEYLPTEKPVIQLVRHNSVGQNAFGQKIVSGYYQVHNLDELKTTIQQIVFEGQDPKLAIRKDVIANELQQPKEGTGEFIYKYVVDVLSGKIDK